MAKNQNTEWNKLKRLFAEQANMYLGDREIKAAMPHFSLKDFRLLQKDIRQRSEAIIKYVDVLSKKYEGICSRDEIMVAISYVEGSTLTYPEIVFDVEFSPLGAMAIWVLDIIRQNGMLEQACEIINNIDFEEMEQVDPPPIAAKGHFLYSDGLLNNLYYVLYAERPAFDGASALGKYWLKLKDLIPSEAINEILNKAEGVIDCYVKCIIDCSNYYWEKLQGLQQNKVQPTPVFLPFLNELGDKLQESTLNLQYSALFGAPILCSTLHSYKQQIGSGFYKRIEPFFNEIYKKEIDLYGLCAAYCLLGVKGDYYASLFTIVKMAFRSIFMLLPWNTKMLTVNMDNVKFDEDIKAAADMSSYYAPYYPIYRHYYPEDGGEFMANFAQYYFLKNGAILPYQDLPNSMIDFNVFSSELCEKFSSYDQFLMLMNRTNELDWIGVEDDEGEYQEEPIEEREEKIEEEGIESSLEVEEQRDFESENERLRKEVETLKKAVYTQERNNRNLERKYEALKIEFDKSHKMMAELNEAIFNRNNAESEIIADKGLEDKLPYTARKRAVVFGGHDTWAKTIKPMLKEVVFVGRGFQFSIELIRNAEVVWIQPNALSHSEYYRIIDGVRTCNKPCHYFKYASALKCAEQFIEVDNNDI